MSCKLLVIVILSPAVKLKRHIYLLCNILQFSWKVDTVNQEYYGSDDRRYFEELKQKAQAVFM